jgi:hypothetical protein
MVQDAVNRFWWPALAMFGPSDTNSPNSGELLKWRVKRKTNDELRQRFVNLTVPQAIALGITLPDPDLRYDEATGNWMFGEIDWAEFFEVIAGNGPCNRDDWKRATRPTTTGRGCVPPRTRTQKSRTPSRRRPHEHQRTGKRRVAAVGGVHTGRTWRTV